MVYFLGSDAEVAITTEASGTCVKVSKDSDGEYTLAAEAAATPTGGYGINDLRATNAQFPADSLVDIYTHIDHAEWHINGIKDLILKVSEYSYGNSETDS